MLRWRVAAAGCGAGISAAKSYNESVRLARARSPLWQTAAFSPAATMSVSSRSLVFAAAVLAAVPPVQAWGPLGHSVVAELAQRHLDPVVEAELERLLAPEHTRSLADVANWPDQIQDDPAQAALWNRTRSQHYVNFRGGSACDYVPPRDCRDGRCVVGGLQHYVDVLGDRSQSDAARREALKFVVHFVGDIHQPLHAGYRDDKGGNTYQVQFDGSGSNLHKVWDSGLLSGRRLDWRAYARMLDSAAPVSLPVPTAPLDDPYAQWAEESCRITAEAGFYPAGHTIDPTYAATWRPVAELRLRQAGRRLAAVLNLALSR